MANDDDLEQHEDGEKRVTPFELFFDLVFVFGFTQVTSLLADGTGWLSLARGMLVLAALWWAWAGYAWLATTTDLAEGRLRLATVAVIAVMLVVGIAAPTAFGGGALVFAVGYLVVRVLHLVMYAMSARGAPRLLRNVLGLAPGTIFSSLLIVAAAWTDGWQAIALWSVGLLFDYAAPLVIPSEGWTIHPAHFAERFGLIFIVALGESLIAIGVGAAGQPIDAGVIIPAVLGVLVVTALWWTYFDVVAIVAERYLVRADRAEQNRIARDSYSYLHLPMIAGVILFALGVKRVMAHPDAPLGQVPAVALVGGAALYLAAHVLFRLRNIRTLNRQRCVAVVVLGALATFAAVERSIDAVTLLAILTAFMMTLVAYEVVRFREARARVRRGEWRT